MSQFQHYFQHYQVTVKGTCFKYNHVEFNFPPDLTTVPFDGVGLTASVGVGRGVVLIRFLHGCVLPGSLNPDPIQDQNK